MEPEILDDPVKKPIQRPKPEVDRAGHFPRKENRVTADQSGSVPKRIGRRGKRRTRN